jgi:carbonic anhydrase/acetyltransferase-like protein (isoleucine patch superfamily)
MLTKIINKLKYFYYQIKFNQFGYGSSLRSPLTINCPKNISIGKSTAIGYKAWLAAMPLTNGKNCTLSIGNNCSIGNFNHIYATQKIIIEDYVLTADKVYISDNMHGYEDVNTPVNLQPVVQKSTVIIGRGTWIGENVCIMGCTIGKQCVIGANAVVTKNVPDYCVAAGNPVKIIKRFCFDTNSWKKTNPDGTFI